VQGRITTGSLQHQQKAKPLFDALRAWLDAALSTGPPQSMTGKALGYLQNERPKLRHYLDDGRLSIDNNPVANAIRPFVIGRQKWLFSDTARGAQSSANLYRLVETAKANGLDPTPIAVTSSPSCPRPQPSNRSRPSCRSTQDPTASVRVTGMSEWG